MNLANYSKIGLSALALSAALAAQSPSRHVGTLIDTGSHYTLAEFQDPNIRLESAVDLSVFVDEPVDLMGAMRSTFSGPTQHFDVASIVLAERSFTSSDVAALASSTRLQVDAPGAANFFVHVSIGHGYTPLTTYGPTVAGVLWMDPTLILSVAGGAMNGRWRGNLLVPNDSFLLGMTLQFQAAVHEAGQPLLFLNSNSMTFAATVD
jgi:hypothetical protein